MHRQPANQATTPDDGPRRTPPRPIRIALVGDRNPAILAHVAIDRSLALAPEWIGGPVEGTWLPTEQLRRGDRRLIGEFHGVWGVPGSPYRHTEGALWAIEHARTQGVPFLGTCGGFQHALLEYARNALGFYDAGHEELDPATPSPWIRQLACALVEARQRVVVTGGRRFPHAYGATAGIEGFHCRYGLNPAVEARLAASPLAVVARAEDGAARAVELGDHPFYIATLFQPERRALAGTLHPLVGAFLVAAAAARASGATFY